MKVSIPFKRQFEDAMLFGNKTMTSRTKRYGTRGDVFEAFGATFKITRVFTRTLFTVAHEFYQEEGFDSPIDFINVWRKIHPRKGWQPYQEVWVHEFIKTNVG